MIDKSIIQVEIILSNRKYLHEHSCTTQKIFVYLPNNQIDE